MGFIGGLLGGGSGANFQAAQANVLNPTGVGQAQQAYNQAQTGLSQQQAFLNALNAQNGIQNQSSVFNQLQGVANGTGPNPAQAMLNQQTGNNVAQQAALMAGQRGAGANVGLLARQAGQQGGAIQQNAVGQGAALQAQQQLGALNQLGGIAGQQVSQQASGLQGYNQAAQQEQQNLLNSIAQQNTSNVAMQSNQNNANAQIANTNASNQAGLLGGVVGGVGSALSSAGLGSAGKALGAVAGGLSQGGSVPGQPKVMGDNEKNDTVPAMLSPGEIVIPRSIMESEDPISGAADFVRQELAKHNKSPKKNFDDGGTAVFQNPTPDLSQPFAQAPAQPQQDVSPPQLDPDLTAKRALYNQEVVGGTGPSMANNKPQFTFGPDGSPPENFDASAWNRAEQRFQNQNDVNKAAEQRTSSAANAKIQMENKARAAAGLPVLPMASNDADAGGQAAAMAAGGPKIGSELNPSGAQASPADPYGILATNNAYMKGLGQQLGGIGQEAKTAGALGQEQSKTLGDTTTQLQNIQARGQQLNDQNLAATHQLMQQYQAGTVDPNHLMSSLGTGGKIATAIGLILGGIGGGLTHQKNPALEYLQAQIDNDVKAQQSELGKRENLVSLNMKQGQSLQDATENAKNQLMALASVQLKQEEAKYAGSLAGARANQAAGELYQKAAGNIGTNAMRSAWAESAAKNPNGQMSLPAELDPARERRVQVGTQVFHAPDKETADKLRPQVEALDQLQSTASRIADFNKNIGTTYNPLSSNSGRASALNREMEAAIAKVEASGGQIGRLVDKFKEMASQAGAFATSKQEGKSKGINDFIAAQKASLIRNNLNSGPAFGK